MSETESVRYELKDPMVITPRLMPGIVVNDGTIHIEVTGTYGARAEWHYVIDAPAGSYEAADLSTVRMRDSWGEEVRFALGELLGFLSYYADPDECDVHEKRMADFGDVAEWLIANREDLSALESELQEA